MPLLGKTRFKAAKIPENLSLEDEIYVCKATGEVYKDYEKFFDQSILCNSLIWTCGTTGQSNLTFTEALESERNSKRQIESVPPSLHLPILHLVTLTNRNSFKDLLDDIYSFAKDRFFIGEEVTVLTEAGEKRTAIIIRVFVSNPNTLPSNHHKKCPILEPQCYQYMSQNQATGGTLMSTMRNTCRNKALFNRESCKLFLREHCDHKNKGAWRIKDSILSKYNLHKVKFNDYFIPPAPIFPSPYDNHYAELQVIESTVTSPNNNTKSRKRELDKRSIEKEWMKTRDDLLCDDLLDLPTPRPIKLMEGNFGRLLMCHDFLHSFKNFCSLDVPFDIVSLATSLNDKSSNNSCIFLEVLQQLLTVCFQVQVAPNGELNTLWKSASKTEIDIQTIMSFIKFFQSVVKKSKSQKWQILQETPLRHLPLDSSSISEVIRIHLLVGYDESCGTSDEDNNEVKVRKRIKSDFCSTNPSIMNKLASGNILDLTQDEKMTVLLTLIDQILSSSTCRDYLDNAQARLRQAHKDLRTHMFVVQRRERDLLNYNFKKKQEEEQGNKKRKDSKAPVTSVVTKKKSIFDLSDKDFEEMPVEGIDWDQLSNEEKDHIRSWSAKKTEELSRLVEDAQNECCVMPLGMDRTYRTYWFLKSAPGIFVEDTRSINWLAPKNLQEPVSQDPDRIKNALKLLNDEINDKGFDNDKGADKEGDKEKKDVEMNKNVKLTDVHTQLEQRGVVEWAVYGEEEELKQLIGRLNRRGVREGALKTSLLSNYEKIVASLQKFNHELIGGKELNGVKIEKKEVFKKEDQIKVEEIKTEAINQTLDTNLNNDDIKRSTNEDIKTDIKTPKEDNGRSGELELAGSLVEMLLDMEDKVYEGSLGVLKDIERHEWRASLENFKKITNGQGNNGMDEDDDVDVKEGQEKFLKDLLKELSKRAIEVQAMVEEKFIGPPIGDDEATKQKKLKEKQDEEEYYQQVQQLQQQQQLLNGGIMENKKSYVPPPTTAVIEEDKEEKVEEEGVEEDPFNENSQDGDNSQISTSFNNNNNTTVDGSPANNASLNASPSNNGQQLLTSYTAIARADVARWKELTSNSRNFSQLYLCLLLLNHSVTWNKSILNTRCKVCHRKKDEDCMLLCDGCNQGFHMYCLRPPIKKIPEGDWYCSTCRPRELSPLAVRKVTRNIKYQDGESDADDGGPVANDDDASSVDKVVSCNGSTTDLNTFNYPEAVIFLPEPSNNKIPKKRGPKKKDPVLMTNTTAPKSTTRSGRGVVSPRIGEDFVVEKVPSCRSTETTVEKRKNRRTPLKNSKYSEDYEFNIDNHSEGEEDEEEDDIAGDDDDDAGSGGSPCVEKKKRGRKPMKEEKRGRKRKSYEEDDEVVFGGEKVKRTRHTKTPSSSACKSSHRNIDSSLKAVETLVGEMMRNESAWPFLKPVSVKEVPDYLEIVSHPMDLSTIKYKLYQYQYTSEEQVLADLKLMFDNCNLYNSPNTPVHNAGLILEDFMDKRWIELNSNSKNNNKSNNINNNSLHNNGETNKGRDKRFSL